MNNTNCMCRSNKPHLVGESDGAQSMVSMFHSNHTLAEVRVRDTACEILLTHNTIIGVKLLQRERERNKSRKKFQGPAGNRTQDLLNASQVLLPLSHWCPWQRSGRYIIYRPQPNPADSLSLGGDPLWTGLRAWVD